MDVTAAALDLMKQFEHLELDAYQDIAGVWTIGYGRTWNVKPGLRITQLTADRMFTNDVTAVATQVRALVAPHASATDNQFSAMVSLAFNVGVRGFLTSSVLRLHLLQTGTAGDAFLLWDKAHVDGVLVEVAGLLNRRRAERTLYLS